MENQTDELTIETRRTIAAERLEMVERFRRSGQTRRAFCESEGVARSTLDWWLRKRKRRTRSGKKKGVAFREVSVVSASMEAAATWSMEIVSPTGWTLRSRQAMNVEDMARLLGGRRC
jgi:hypothetical protein